MRILGARIFLSLLAGKLEHFEQPILTNEKKKKQFLVGRFERNTRKLLLISICNCSVT